MIELRSSRATRRDPEGIELRTLAHHKPHRLAERMRNHQDVGEQDRRVEPEAPDRLQRHLGGELRRETQIEETAGLLAHRPILRQIAAGLPHQPDRRRLPFP